jgi:cysteine desulfurase / selenocysteine lyase
MSKLKYENNYRKLVAGVETAVPLHNGRPVTAINFDNAATTPPFISVLEEIINFAPWYSSVHRGAGYKSRISSNLYETSREIIANFVKADLKHHTIIYVKNSTEAINKLASRFTEKSKKNVILSTFMEHHSNDLPWRNHYTVDYIAIDQNGKLLLNHMESKLIEYKGAVKLVALTGSSNVTGYINPIYEAAVLAHQYNAKILVDGAQLVPHVPFDMKPFHSMEHIDYLVFSAHKMYAPFGAGVLIGPKETFEKGSPDYTGGGTVEIVTHNYIKWNTPPLKEEAGSPNVMGIAALVAAVRTLNEIGMTNIEKYENSLTEYAIKKMKDIPYIQLYGNKYDCKERLGIIAFNIEGMPHDMVAAILSYEGGIAVRSGCFCAQPYVQKLLDLSPEEIQERIHSTSASMPGMVRISFGIYNTCEEIDIFIKMLHHIVKEKNAFIEKYAFLASNHSL